MRLVLRYCSTLFNDTMTRTRTFDASGMLTCLDALPFGTPCESMSRKTHGKLSTLEVGNLHFGQWKSWASETLLALSIVASGNSALQDLRFWSPYFWSTWLCLLVGTCWEPCLCHFVRSLTTCGSGTWRSGESWENLVPGCSRPVPKPVHGWKPGNIPRNLAWEPCLRIFPSRCMELCRFCGGTSPGNPLTENSCSELCFENHFLPASKKPDVIVDEKLVLVAKFRNTASSLQDRPHKCRLSHSHRRAVWNTSRLGKPGNCKRKPTAKMGPTIAWILSGEIESIV